jgi:solute carrier family 26 (sodium-independent sulfate anion transporter), member 11
MASTSTKVGHGLAKVLGIRLNERQAENDALTRGESTFTNGSGDTYIEEEPRAIDWIRELIPDPSWYGTYARNLFPFTRWIMRYNLQWLIGDLVAGVTVGCVVVPQGMAYAKLAELPVEYGLYSSFMGVLIYWFFATSKDITIGPVAVMSTIVGGIVLQVQEKHPDVEGHVVASALAIICGAIITFLGLARLGWVVEFIPLVAISAFMTGSAISIAAGQVPNLMGIKVKGFNTRGPTYQVIINTLKYLGHTKLDAAMGLTALTMLYLIRFACGFAAKKQPNRAKTYFFVSTLRTAFVILLYTGISAGVNIHRRKDPAFQILGKVPRGFQHAAVPTVNTELISWFASELPASVIVLLIEHIAISKSFGRINNYTIDPSQELVAIGVTNLLGPFLGGYPATGSFSRTAIKSKAGVRTPFAGVITAVVVLLAIYALPAVFFYIPQSALAAVIIHAVGDLITPPNTVYQFYRVQPLEIIIFFAGVFVTIFSSIENGIYTTICVSLALLLFRLAKANGHFVGRVKVHSVVGDHLLDSKDTQPGNPPGHAQHRNIFLPLDHNDGSNPSVQPEQPYPGVFIYRFSEGFNYPNANHYTDYLTAFIFKHTRRTNPNSWGRPGDRPWNNPGPRRGQVEADTSHLPTLKAVILDMSAVNNVDVTSVQNLIDVRNQLDRYASPNVVQWHLACITNRWTKRALAAGGFGYPTLPTEEYSRWKPIFSVAEIGGSHSAAAEAQKATNKALRRNSFYHNDVEQGRPHSSAAEKDAITIDEHNKDGSSENSDIGKVLTSSKAYKRHTPVHGLSRPLFHIDLTAALQAAIANVEEQYGPLSEGGAQRHAQASPSDSDEEGATKEKI